MERKTRLIFNRPGDAHGSTFSVYRRIPVFKHGLACEIFLDTLACASQRYEVDVWAYVVMPDHVHLLAQPRQLEYDYSAFLKALKQVSSQKILEALPDVRERVIVTRPNGRTERRLWQQGGGYDRNYFTGGHTWDFIDYMHNNPIAAGLCESPEDWPWSSASFYATAQASSGFLKRCPWFRS